jgi:uncharacterized damage-inducible protein DinB
MLLPELFAQQARYNRWANARLYEAASALSDADYRRHTGVFFGSLCGTLNHLLLADQTWLARLTGEGPRPSRHDQILFDALSELATARADEDDRIIRVVDAERADAFSAPRAYQTLAGKPQQQPLAHILLHFFNHQTHHRGQAHAALSILTGTEPPSLDLLAFQRGIPAPDLRQIAQSLNQRQPPLSP